jgi:hypothetical protein
MWESCNLQVNSYSQLLQVNSQVIITTWPRLSLSTMGRERQRSPSPRGRRHDGRSQEHEYERRRDRSRDHQSSSRRDERRGEDYDSKRRQRSRDRSRGRSSDDEDRRESSKKCGTMHLKCGLPLTNVLKAEEGQIRGTQGSEGGEEEIKGRRGDAASR